VEEKTFMTSVAPVVDIEALLTPILGENPAGSNLQYSGLHDEIREARRSEENVEKEGYQTGAKFADWDQVTNLATDALATQSKDLQVAAWLAEALVKVHGFAGLRDSLKVMARLHEKFWDNLFPEIDEGDLEGRANSLSWLDRQTALAIREIPLTKGQGDNYDFNQWEESKEFDIPENLDSLDSSAQEKFQALKAQAVREKKTTGEQFRVAKNKTRRAFYEELNTVLNESWQAFQALDKMMDQKFDRQTPGLGDLKKTLENIRQVIDKVVKEKRIAEPDAVEATGTSNEGESPAQESAGSPGYGGSLGGTAGAIRGRVEALRRLGEVAEYFQKTEPHSPVAYLVQRAVKWGQMPLDKWLQEVIKDSTVLEHLRETLGMNTNPEG
jgi:type VI secretion system protein ImpA